MFLEPQTASATGGVRRDLAGSARVYKYSASYNPRTLAALSPTAVLIAEASAGSVSYGDAAPSSSAVPGAQMCVSTTSEHLTRTRACH